MASGTCSFAHSLSHERFEPYCNNNQRPKKGCYTPAAAGDLGPEGLAFIPAASSPNGKNLLVAGNEVSGTTTVFQIDPAPSSTPGATAQGSTTAGIITGVVATVASLIAIIAPIFGGKNLNSLLTQVQSLLSA